MITQSLPINRILFTKDPKRVGNAIIRAYEQGVYYIRTDYGNDIKRTMEEIAESFFYEPEPNEDPELYNGLREVGSSHKYAVRYNEEGLKLHGRRKGYTTRIVDDMIQELFTNGIVGLRDHYNGDRETAKRMRARNAKIIANRLMIEHGVTMEDIQVDKDYTYIKLLKFEDYGV